MKRIIIFLILIILFLAGLGAFYKYYWITNHNPNELVLYGNVDVRQVDIGFRVQGRVVTMPFQEGDFVKKGSLMIVMDDQPYLDIARQAQAAIEANRVNLANAEILLKRRQSLIGDGSVSQEDLDNALASRDTFSANLKQAQANLGVALTDLNDTKVYAPSDGIILTRIREPGTVVKVADPVYTLSLLDPIWIRAFISEPYLGVVYPNMPAEVYTDTQNGKVYRGHVGFISPVAEFTPKSVETTQLRTDLVYRLRIICENPDQGLRQGMPVTVKLKINSKETSKDTQGKSSE